MKIAFVAAAAFAGLFGLASVGHAAGAERVEVRFLQPERFADAEDSARDRERALEELGAHLKRQAAKRLGEGQSLLIEVRDVDLAGVVEPVGPSMHRIRVLRDVTWPRMRLHYVLQSEGKTLREADADLNRMGYLDGVQPYPEGESLRYEKAMIDDWLRKEFSSKR